MATASSGLRDAEGPDRRKRSAFWIHFQRNRGAVVSLGVIAVLVLAAVFAPLLTPYHPAIQHLAVSLQRPSAKHLLGTDQFGRDVFTRLLYGLRTGFTVSLGVVAISVVVGTIWGTLSGFYGGSLDTVLMRVVDVFMAFPFLLLALMIVAALGPGIYRAMIAVGIAYTPIYARLVRSVVLGVKGLDFVSASRSIGAADLWIMRRHFLPNLVTTLTVQATLNIGTAIIDISGLSFLGMGAQQPRADLGLMLATGQKFILEAPYLVLAPGIAIVIVVLTFNLVGDGLRDALDPRSRRRT